MCAGTIYPDIVSHGLKLTSAILGGAPAAPGIPQRQLIGEAESLAGQNTMGLEAFLDGKSLLPKHSRRKISLTNSGERASKFFGKIRTRESRL